MEKNITLGTSADINFVVNSISNGSKSVIDGSKNLISCIKNLINSIKSLLQSCKQPIEWLQSYYSIIMEKEVSMKQTLLLIATQFTFVLGILPADINLALRAAFLGSFAFCLHLCKKSFQEKI
mgnify:FL=1